MSESGKMLVQLTVEELGAIIEQAVVRALQNNGHAQEKGVYLTPEQAAKIMGVDTNWLYRHRKTLPFAKGVTKKMLRFDEAGLRRWMQSRR
jgi:Helix-turn-helix domain